VSQDSVSKKGSYKIPLQAMKREQSLHGIQRTPLHIPELMNAIHRKQKFAHAAFKSAPVIDESKTYSFDELSSLAYVDSVLHYELADANIFSFDRKEVAHIEHVDDDSITSCHPTEEASIGDIFVATEYGASFHSNSSINSKTAQFFTDPSGRKHEGFILLRKVRNVHGSTKNGCRTYATEEIHPYELINGFTSNSTIKKVSSLSTYLQYNNRPLDRGLTSCQKYSQIASGANYIVTGEANGEFYVTCPTNMVYGVAGCAGVSETICDPNSRFRHKFGLRCYLFAVPNSLALDRFARCPDGFSPRIVGCFRDCGLFCIPEYRDFTCDEGFNLNGALCSADFRAATSCPENLQWDGALLCNGNAAAKYVAKASAAVCAEYAYGLAGFYMNYDQATRRAREVITIPGIEGFSCVNCYAYLSSEIFVHLDFKTSVDLFGDVTAALGFEVYISGSIGANVDIEVENLSAAFIQYIKLVPAEEIYRTIPVYGNFPFT
jgi:hypothetical protein